MGLAVILGGLLGCAAPAPVLRPADLPFHDAQPPLITLHWRLDRTEGAVVARGIAEVASPDRLDAAVLELRALDRAGRVVGQTTTRIQPRSFVGDGAWPFEIRLAVRGGEDRYVLRVAGVSWRGLRGR